MKVKTQLQESFGTLISGSGITDNMIKYGCKSKVQKVKVAAMKTYVVIAQSHRDTEDFLPELLDYIVETADDQNNDLISTCLEILMLSFRVVSFDKVSVTAANEAGKITKYLSTLMKHN